MKTITLITALTLLVLGTIVTAQDPQTPPTSPNLPEKIRLLEERMQKLEAQLHQKSPSEKAIAGANGDDDDDQKGYALPAGFRKRGLASNQNAAGPNPAGASSDSDGDGLTDAEEATLRTQVNNPDTDGDGLLDGWEVHGVNGLDLQALGASPLHKDIFVEMDFMERASATNGFAPDNQVLDTIVSVFKKAPVLNPDGRKGINIHLERGNKVPLDSDLNPYLIEFNTIKATHFSPAKAPVYHYMIWADGYGGGSSSGVSMDIPHSDFLVTLGKWNGGAGGTNPQKIGTFIHELGHNLNLTHGGGPNDHVNFKPNHLSVMNYTYQTRGVTRGNQQFFDYQRFALPRLTEAALSESNGLNGGPRLNSYKIFYNNQDVPAKGAIDWNLNGQIDSGTTSTDLNGDFFLDDLQGTVDQWNSLIYTGGAIGSTGTVEGAMENARASSRILPFIELTEDMDRRIR